MPVCVVIILLQGVSLSHVVFLKEQGCTEGCPGRVILCRHRSATWFEPQDVNVCRTKMSAKLKATAASCVSACSLICEGAELRAVNF